LTAVRSLPSAAVTVQASAAAVAVPEGTVGTEPQVHSALRLNTAVSEAPEAQAQEDRAVAVAERSSSPVTLSYGPRVRATAQASAVAAVATEVTEAKQAPEAISMSIAIPFAEALTEGMEVTAVPAVQGRMPARSR
jgi:hypothetical protein